MKMRVIAYALVLVSIPLLFCQSVSAQSVMGAIQSIDLTLSTSNPSPGQTVTITAKSYISDLDASDIVWTLNGSLYQKGVGITSIEVKAPALGKQLVATITASTPDGKTLTNTASINSGNIDLILETDGYTPPFFRGKIPLVYQNNYRVIAVPHLANSSGVEYNPKNLVYQWRKDYRVVQEQSGYGKQVFSWKDEAVPRERIIEVKVSTTDGSAHAERSIAVSASSPFIGFYRDDPLYGALYNIASEDNVSLGKSREASILAVPYGFNIPDGSINNLSYSWFLNSVKQNDLNQNQSITLRAPADASGSSNIELTITNIQDILETARGGFTASFVKSSDTGTGVNSQNYNGI